MFQPSEKNGIRNAILLWIIVFLLAYNCTAKSETLGFLETESLDLEYAKLDALNRDPIAPHYTGRWRDRVALEWESNLTRINSYKLFWHHRIHAETINSGAVKTTGWEWKLGLDLGRVSVFHHHHSRHVLDERVEYPGYGKKSNQFPVEDSLVVRFRFIGKGDK